MLERITRAEEAYSRFGYFVMAEPVPGEEATFATHLEQGLARIDETMASLARRHRYRGRSKAALVALHTALPVPTWGVEVDSK